MRLTEADYRKLTGQKSTAKGQKAAPPKGSPNEVEMERQLEMAGITGWVREYEFHPERKFRLDFAWPAEQVAVEVEGGVHRIKSRFARDITKYNSLALRGWLLVRVTPKMIGSGKALATVREALEVRR